MFSLPLEMPLKRGTRIMGTSKQNSFDLHDLHPQAQLPSPRAVPAAPPVQCKTSHVRAALLSFPTASALGPSGLRADHLRGCITSVSTFAASRLLEAITLLCNRCLAGTTRVLRRPLPFRALAAIQKDDSVRPIAVGEVMRRLVAKVAFKQVLPRAQEPPPRNLVSAQKTRLLTSRRRCGVLTTCALPTRARASFRLTCPTRSIQSAEPPSWKAFGRICLPSPGPFFVQKKNRPFLEKISEKKNRFYLLPIHCWLCFAWMHI